MILVCTSQCLDRGPSSTNYIRIRVGPCSTDNNKLGYGRVAQMIFGFGFFQILSDVVQNISTFSCRFIPKKNYFYLHTNHNQSENNSIELFGTVCVANEKGTWTRNPRLVPKRGEEINHDKQTYVDLCNVVFQSC